MTAPTSQGDRFFMQDLEQHLFQASVLPVLKATNFSQPCLALFSGALPVAHSHTPSGSALTVARAQRSDLAFDPPAPPPPPALLRSLTRKLFAAPLPTRAAGTTCFVHLVPPGPGSAPGAPPRQCPAASRAQPPAPPPQGPPPPQLTERGLGHLPLGRVPQFLGLGRLRLPAPLGPSPARLGLARGALGGCRGRERRADPADGARRSSVPPAPRLAWSVPHPRGSCPPPPLPLRPRRASRARPASPSGAPSSSRPRRSRAADMAAPSSAHTLRLLPPWPPSWSPRKPEREQKVPERVAGSARLP